MLRSLRIAAGALALCALPCGALAGSGFLISPPLSSATGTLQCGVLNTHPTKNAILSLRVYDQSCFSFSYAMNLSPGEHEVWNLPFAPGNRAICVVDLNLSTNEVARTRIVASLSALDSAGQPTAALPITHFQGAFTGCSP